jgi:ribosomal protein S18 acetylase RimI-like enzyme
MSSLPNGYTTRPTTPEDRNAILELTAASDRSLIGEVDYHAEDLAAEWGRPRFELDTDPVLVLGPDGVPAGYAYVWESEPGEKVVGWAAPHPDHAHLYGYLLERIEERARERLAGASGERTLRIAIYESESDGARLLREAGFVPVRYFWRMAIPLTGTETPPPPPPGIHLRPLDPDRDREAAHRAIEEAFEDHWGTPTPPFEEWVEEEMTGPDFDPSLWVLAEENGEVAGVLSGRRTGERGWVGQLGVRPAWRGRGVGAALLRASFAGFASRGVPEVILSVDSENTTGATRLYERVGMHSSFRFDFYEKRLEP